MIDELVADVMHCGAGESVTPCSPLASKVVEKYLSKTFMDEDGISTAVQHIVHALCI